MRRIRDMFCNRSWSEEPWLDHIFSCVLVAVHILIVRVVGAGDLLIWIDKSQRLTIYGTGASVISIFGGLGAIAATIYVAATGERARKVRQHFHEELRKNWTYLLLDVGISAGACLVAQVLDSDRDVHYARFVFEYAFLLAAFSFIRLVWLFDRMVGVADRDIVDNVIETAPELNPVWKDKLKSEHGNHPKD